MISIFNNVCYRKLMWLGWIDSIIFGLFLGMNRYKYCQLWFCMVTYTFVIYNYEKDFLIKKEDAKIYIKEIRSRLEWIYQFVRQRLKIFLKWKCNMIAMYLVEKKLHQPWRSKC